MATNTLVQRMARTRRNQARALAGETGPIEVHTAIPGGQSWVAAEQSYDSLVREFEILLPRIGDFYGYAAEDVAVVRKIALAGTRQAMDELELCVRHWRIEVVVNRIGGLAEGVTDRAWIQFRQSIMGLNVDENGEAYEVDALECPPPASTA